MRFLSALVAAVLFSMSAFAQYNQSQTRAGANRSSGSKGLVAGLVYSNLSDFKSKAEGENFVDGVSWGKYSETFKGGLHAGLYGVHVGYKDIYAFGSFGFNSGVQWMRGLNGSETASSINIYKVLGDLVLPLGDIFSLSGGINISYFDGFGSGQNGLEIKSEPGAGIQAAVEARLSQMSISAGAQVLGVTSQLKSSYIDNGHSFRAESKNESLYSGFITQISYTF